MSVMAGPIEEQLTRLQETYPGAEAISLPDGTALVTIPRVSLPPGWNQPVSGVSFIVPVGYPMARPDCFWADSNLRLAGGGMPQNAGVNQAPGQPEPRLWFSWHLAAWNPASDSLLTYLRVIQRRFAELR
jgi:hypothetical protein